ncbi:MAG: siderophore-interacting protein, partial [Acidimicrobiales bacterium]|nr:siderophore-interacting protein [Acidimicrobiales bacterium]
MMKALGAEDITLTVTGVEDLAPHYRRIRFVAPGVFDSFVPEPASWIRLWVPDPGEPERELQRGYTYVD